MPSGTDLENDALASAKAEVAACLTFLTTEMMWEYFRVEQLYFEDEKKANSSEENARKLKNYLAEKGHGIAFLREHGELAERNAALEAQLKSAQTEMGELRELFIYGDLKKHDADVRRKTREDDIELIERESEDESNNGIVIKLRALIEKEKP
jgi:hypothetical protein